MLSGYAPEPFAGTRYQVIEDPTLGDKYKFDPITGAVEKIVFPTTTMPPAEAPQAEGSGLLERAREWLSPEPTVKTEPVVPEKPSPYKIPDELKDIFPKLTAQQKSAILQIGTKWESLNEQEKKDIIAAIRQNPQIAFEILKRLKSGQ